MGVVGVAEKWTRWPDEGANGAQARRLVLDQPPSAHLKGMPDQSQQDEQLTTSQLLARFDARQRAAASRRSRPLDRSTTRGLMHEGPLLHLVLLDSKGRLNYLAPWSDAPTPHRLTPDRLCDLLLSAYQRPRPTSAASPLLFADTSALRTAVKILDAEAARNPSPVTRQVSRLMTYRSGLPFSMHAPVLTEALAHRYWLPSEAKTDSLNDWLAAFGLHTAAGSLSEGIKVLAAKAGEGHDPVKIIQTAAKLEWAGASSARFAGSSAQNSAFMFAESLNEAYSGIITTDPGLRDRNTLAGVVSRIKIHQRLSKRIEAYVDNVARFREGAKVWVFDSTPGEFCSLTMHSMELTGDALMMNLSTPTAATHNSHVLDHAIRAKSHLYVTPAPFLMIRSSAKNHRWTAAGDDRSLPVDIPVDVALAGGPVEG